MRGRAAVLAALALGCSHAQRPAVTGALRFTCDPPDARVVLDEEDLGPCALWTQRWLGLRPGVHRLVVHREGYFPQESEVTGNGRREAVDVRLRRVPE